MLNCDRNFRDCGIDVLDNVEISAVREKDVIRTYYTDCMSRVNLFHSYYNYWLIIAYGWFFIAYKVGILIHIDDSHISISNN